MQKPPFRFELITKNNKTFQKNLVCPISTNSLGKSIQRVLSIVCT